MTTTQKNFLNVFGLLFLLTIVITKTGCKKSDIYQIKNSKDPVTEKFFEAKTVLNPTAVKVLQFLKKLDEKNDFIRTFAKKEGFAIWDKAIVRTNNLIIGRTTNSNEDTTVVIPLVIENSNQVNNYLRAVISSDSIVVSLYRGEDYKNRVFGTSVQPIGAAEEYALKFITLDNHVFRNNKSRILDNKLFAKGQIIPDTSTKPRYVEINVQENISGRLIACVTTTVTYFSCGTLNYCGDNCDGATGNCPTGECTGWVWSNTVCEDSGGGTGGISIGSGSNTGSGSTGSGGTGGGEYGGGTGTGSGTGSGLGWIPFEDDYDIDYDCTELGTCYNDNGTAGPGVTQHTKDHVLKGEIKNGKATGCHSLNAITAGLARWRPNSNSPTTLVGGIKGGYIDIKNSMGAWIPKAAFTTFYPSTWSDQKIIDEITIAFGNKVRYANNGNPYWEGLASNGLKIRMFLKPDAANGEILTAFPIAN